MKRIGLISDTHSYFEEKLPKFLSECDEIWHAGDIGSLELCDKLNKIKPLKAVYGNIDNTSIRKEYPEYHFFTCENVGVLLIHIAGSMPKYNTQVLELIQKHKPKLLICGHSHIAKVAFDKANNVLYMNPGAAGNHGFHQIKTMLRFTLENGDIKDLELIELGKR
ncbi:MAG: metallophosphoesterase family protein [Bacteroidetes bacterium]|nr:metallophosphoesterase family protein [Bacteroidota bacterium]